MKALFCCRSISARIVFLVIMPLITSGWHTGLAQSRAAGTTSGVTSAPSAI